MSVVELKVEPRNEDRSLVEGRIRGVLDGHEPDDIAGFAFVIWSKDGASTCDAATKNGSIPSILIPDFVRNRLLADRIETWTIDAINESR